MLYGMSRLSFDLFLDGTDYMQIRADATHHFTAQFSHDSFVNWPIDWCFFYDTIDNLKKYGKKNEHNKAFGSNSHGFGGKPGIWR